MWPQEGQQVSTQWLPAFQSRVGSPQASQGGSRRRSVGPGPNDASTTRDQGSIAGSGSPTATTSRGSSASLSTT
jgi:hypothetical protein